MNIKSLIATTACAIVLGIPAGFANKQGPYIGAQLGVSNMASKGNMEMPNITIMTFETLSKSSYGLSTDVIAGYLFSVSKVLVGGEATLGLDTTNSKRYLAAVEDPTADDTLKLRRKLTSSFSGVLGVNAHEKLFAYAKLGLGVSRFKTSLLDSPKPKKSSTNPSLLTAVGLEVPVKKGLSARAEISCEHFGSIKATPINQLGRAITTNTRHKNVRIFGFKAGAVYHI